MDVLWYVRRLSRMGPREISGRVVTMARIREWRAELDSPVPPLPAPAPAFTATLPAGALAAVSDEAGRSLLATADRLMAGHAEYFGVQRDDMVAPDWSLDPKTGRRAPADTYAFDVPYRSEDVVGDVKQLWEPSRHQHLTVLAAAYALTGDDAYAHRVADHLKSWWAANPPMRGVHWISGIELGIRLLSWVWVRRLLEGWPAAPDLFEHNAEAVHQIHMHQRWLAAFPSRGSSANNHVIAEDAGQLAAACAFGWFAESANWRADAMASLDLQLRRNTFPSGINRELASEYHGLVLELGLAAVAEAGAAGLTVPDTTWRVLLRMTDALAAVVDDRLHPPRQGDGDDGYGLVVDGTAAHRWASLLATGDALFGRIDWWPPSPPMDVRTPLLAALLGRRSLPDVRPTTRPAHFADAGLTVLRAPGRGVGGATEVWCRFDGGPHGFGSIAAHAHADALSVELRCGGVDVLADPGCYCYHGEQAWRAYFRSTLGHNTLELDGTDQSASGGPFLWVRQAASRVIVAHPEESGVSRWVGEHNGYGRRGHPVTHRRTAELDARARELRLVDEVLTDRRHSAKLAFHLGPAVAAELDGSCARLTWIGPTGGPAAATLALPDTLQWQVYRGQEQPPRGWYSPGFGRLEPAVTLVGVGLVAPDSDPLCSALKIDG